jgi:hypothetical protein
MKRKSGLLGVIATLAIAVGSTAPAAHAATANPYNPYNPYALCGVGFTLARTEGVVRDADPTPVATFYLMYNQSTDKFCGITIKSRYVGVNTEAMAGVGGATGSVVTDSGPHSYFAGPVRDRPGFGSTGRCVLYGASLTDPAGRTYYHKTANPAIGWSRYCPVGSEG